MDIALLCQKYHLAYQHLFLLSVFDFYPLLVCFCNFCYSLCLLAVKLNSNNLCILFFAEIQPHLSIDIIQIMEQRLSAIERRSAFLQDLVNTVIADNLIHLMLLYVSKTSIF